MMMKAKKAPIEEVEMGSLNLGSSKVKILGSSEPPKKQGGIKVQDVDDLL